MDALVRHMVPTADYYPDRAYLFAFLLSSRLFIKPHELLGEVCALCDAQQHLGGKDPPSKVCNTEPQTTPEFLHLNLNPERDDENRVSSRMSLDSLFRGPG